MKKILKIFAFLFILGGGGQSCLSVAAELGANPPTQFAYGALGGSAIEGKVQATGMVGVRQSWSPFDFVAEVVVRERLVAHLLLAHQFGDVRVLGGVGLNEATNPGIVVGADINNVILRFGVYDSSAEVCTGRYWRRYCQLETKSNASMFVGYTWQLDSR